MTRAGTDVPCLMFYCHQTTQQATPGNTYNNRTGTKTMQEPKETATVIELFFHLIKCGMGKAQELPRTPDTQEWDEMFNMAKKQTLAGIAFAGIEKLPQEQRPPKTTLLQWYNLAVLIRKTNAGLNKKCIAVSEKFKSEGFANCILKGQGLAQLYPDPTLRTPGDIDIWLDGGDRKAIEYVKRYFPDCSPTYHHVDFPINPDLEIEIHYRPSWSYSPITDKRLQRFFLSQSQEQFNNLISTPEGCFPAPTTAFNRIYILLHIYRHLFFEGIGMRQILDYYYVLQQEMTGKEKAEYISALKHLKLKKFAGALMYVMQQMFGLDEAHTFVKPNPKLGKFLMQEIMIAGNFGKYDHRYNLGKHEYSFKRALETIKRNATLITRFPGEILWSPYFKTWHYFWRKRHE